MTVFLCLPTRPAPCLLPALMTLLGLAVPLFCWIFGPEHLTESSLTSLCLKKVFFLQKDKGEGMLNSYCLIFFLFPSHYHSCSNLSNVSKVWPSLNFLCKKEYVMAGKNLLSGLLKLQLLLFCILWFYRHDLQEEDPVLQVFLNI